MNTEIIRMRTKIIIEALLSYIQSKLNLFSKKRVANTFLVSGTPRGGTTWVAESVAKALGTRRTLWEPLQDGNTAKKNLGFSKRPFLNKEFRDHGQKTFFDNLIGGKQANVHLLRLSQFPSNFFTLFLPHPLLIKFVRGNGVVGLLREEYDLPKPIVVLRHPCAVVASQMKMGEWEDHPHIDEEFLKKFPEVKKYISEDVSLPERLAMTWACDVLSAKNRKSDVHLVYYEELVINGPAILCPILAEWGYDISKDDMAVILGQSSTTTHSWSDHTDITKKLHRWEDQLKEPVINSIIDRVLSIGVKDYDANSLPVHLQKNER